MVDDFGARLRDENDNLKAEIDRKYSRYQLWEAKRDEMAVGLPLFRPDDHEIGLWFNRNAINVSYSGSGKYRSTVYRRLDGKFAGYSTDLSAEAAEEQWGMVIYAENGERIFTTQAPDLAGLHVKISKPSHPSGITLPAYPDSAIALDQLKDLGRTSSVQHFYGEIYEVYMNEYEMQARLNANGTWSIRQGTAFSGFMQNGYYQECQNAAMRLRQTNPYQDRNFRGPEFYLLGRLPHESEFPL